MTKKLRMPLAAATTFTLALALAACGGGGGGGGSTTPPVPGAPNPGGATPTPPGATPTPPGATPTPTGTATPTPSAAGTLSLNGHNLANATVVFTCGCSGEGGQISTDANGAYTIAASATAIPAQSTPYSPPGHNLLVVGYDNASATQSWTMVFLGSSPATDLNLSSTPNNMAANVNDTAANAAALYLYYQAGQLPSADKTFDWFNFNQIIAFAQHLRTSPSANEQKLLGDVTAQQAAGKSLYPGFLPQWNPSSKYGFTNATLTSDIKAVATDGLAVDATLPTPCPAADACSGAPTP